MDKDCCDPRTAGGNDTITNGHEQEPLDRMVQIPSRAEGAQDSEFH